MASCEQESLQQRWQAYQELDQLRDHWYWRPGWRPGRSFYTWHLTFEGATEAHDLIHQLQADLDFPALDLVPIEGLHLTMQGVGFVDEVSKNDLAAIIRAAHDLCRELTPFKISLGPVDPDPEGIGLLVAPWAPVDHLRRTIRRAISSVWNAVPEEEAFRPHVTIAYSGAAAPTDKIRTKVAVLRDLPPVATEVGQVQLIALRRDERVYHWDVVATVPLGRG